MTRAGLFTTVAMLLAGLLGACSNFRPHASSSSTRGRTGDVLRPGAAPGLDGAGGRGIPGRAPAGGDAGSDREARRACRTGSRPSGWIAIAYVRGGEGECAIRAKRDSGFTVAVLAYYAERKVEEVLDVCADERVPRGWTIDDTDAEVSDACPGAERKGSSTYRMRRVR